MNLGNWFLTPWKLNFTTVEIDFYCSNTLIWLVGIRGKTCSAACQRLRVPIGLYGTRFGKGVCKHCTGMIPKSDWQCHITSNFMGSKCHLENLLRESTGNDKNVLFSFLTWLGYETTHTMKTWRQKVLRITKEIITSYSKKSQEESKQIIWVLCEQW